MIRSKSISCLTPTMCSLLNIPLPANNEHEQIREITDSIKPDKINKCLIFCADAIGKNIFDRYPDYLERIIRISPMQVAARAEFPSVTPVCFASMFTGAPPSVHGIHKYEKPVIKTETIFDTAARSQLQVAVISEMDSSIGSIFLERDADYFRGKGDRESAEKALEIVDKNNHDFIVVYVCGHDDNLHAFTPYSKEALDAVAANISMYEGIAKQCSKSWKNDNYIIAFAPDHGSHIDESTGHGVHGLDIDDDMNVYHFYGIYRNKSSEK